MKINYIGCINIGIESHYKSSAIFCYKDTINELISCDKNCIIKELGAIIIMCKGHVNLKGLEEDTDTTLISIAKNFNQYGIDTLKKLQGHFTLVIINRKNDETYIIRDKVGTQPIYYKEENSVLSYSDNCKALSKKAEISQQALYHYFYFHYIPSPNTIYKNIKALLPGQYLHFKNNKTTTKTYWTTNDILVKYQERTTASLFHTIEKGFQDLRKNTGCFLSGGLDSSTVLGLLAKKNKEPKSFSMGFEVEGFDETAYAKKAAEYFKSEFHSNYIKPEDIIEHLPHLAKSIDQPFGNASLLPAYICALQAKNAAVECLLAGDGGDELFGGNERYLEQQYFEYYETLPKIIRSRFITPLINISRRYIKDSKILEKCFKFITLSNMHPSLRQARHNLLNQIGHTSIFSDNFIKKINLSEPENQLRSTFNLTAGKSILKKMLASDLKYILADNDLRKVQYACQTAAIDVRFPLLNDDLIDYSFSLPDKEKIKGRSLRPFYRKAMKGFLPEDILKKQKHGFGLPFGTWLLTSPALKNFTQDILKSFSTRNIVKASFIENIITELHPKQPNYYGVLIWNMLLLELWLQHHYDSFKI